MIRPRLLAIVLLVAPLGAVFAQGFPRVLSGIGDDDIKGATTDASGNLYILGEFDGGLAVDPSGAIADLVDTDGANDGDEDIFVARFGPDGTLNLAFSFGSLFDDDPGDIAVDGDGNIFVGGSADDAIDFDPGPGTDIRGISGTDEDPFIAKYAPDGTLIWAAMLPTTVGGDVVGVATDSSGSVYAVGGFDGSADFDPSSGTFFLPAAGPIAEEADDGFVWKLDGDGAFAWADHAGGSSFDEMLDIAVLANDNPVVLGLFTSDAVIRINDMTLFNPTAAGSDGSSTFMGQPLPVVLGFNGANGASSLVAAALGSMADSTPLVFGNSLTVDSSGRILIAGDFLGEVDFDPASDSAQATASGMAPTGFVWALTSAGGFDSIATYAGDDLVTLDTIATDTDNNVLVGGDFYGTVTLGMDPMMNLVEFTSAGMDPSVNRDALLFKLNATGDLQWGRALGGVGDETVDGMVTDTNGNTYLSGQFTGQTDLDPGPPDDAVISVQDDLFIAKFAADGATVRAPASSGATTVEDTAVPVAFLAPADDTAAVTHYRLAGVVDGAVFTDSALTMPIPIDGFIADAFPLILHAQPDADVFGDMSFTLQSASSANILDTGGALEVVIPVESAPDVAAFSSGIVKPTDSDHVIFSLQFDEDVTGVDVSDFQLDVSGIVGASLFSVSGSGANYQVTATTGSGDGSLRVDLVDDDTIVDVDNGNSLTGSGTQVGNASSDMVSIERIQVDLSAFAAIADDQVLGKPPVIVVTVRNGGPDLATAAAVSIITGDEFGTTTWICTASDGALCVSGSDLNDAGSGPVTAMVDIPAGGQLEYRITGTAMTDLTQIFTASGSVTEAVGAELDPGNNVFNLETTIGLFVDGFETP